MERFEKLQNKEVSPAQKFLLFHLDLFKGEARVRRFGNKDKEPGDLDQSLSEHVKNMNELAHAFFDHNPELRTRLDFEKITRMIASHDVGELVVGDTAETKSVDFKDREKAGALSILALRDKAFSSNTVEIYEEYEKMESPEARFVKALDLLEGNITIINHEGYDKSKFEKNKIIDDLRLEEISPALLETLRLSVRFIRRKKNDTPSSVEKPQDYE